MNRKRIIIHSIIICLVLFMLYSLNIQQVIPGWLGESQWSNNIIAAEELIYKSTTPHTVIIGSSMAARLESVMFSGNVINLSFAGKAVFDGLYILDKSKHVPSVVLVETNLLTRPRDDSFVKPLFQQPFYSLKRHMPALRERHRPLTDLTATGRLLKNNIRLILERSNQGDNNKATLKKSPARLNKTVVSSDEDPLFSRRVERQVVNFESIPSGEMTQDIMKELKTAVDVLISRGSKVVLFEMPMHPLLCDSLKVKHMRAAILDTFANDQYLILRPPNCSEYRTTDAIHLPLQEAKRYAINLQKQCSVHNFTIGKD